MPVSTAYSVAHCRAPPQGRQGFAANSPREPKPRSGAPLKGGGRSGHAPIGPRHNTGSNNPRHPHSEAGWLPAHQLRGALVNPRSERSAARLGRTSDCYCQCTL
jgi:hypothetical protein